MHKALLALSAATTQMAAFAAAPVVEEKQVIRQAVGQRSRRSLTCTVGVWRPWGSGFGIAALAGFNWRTIISIIGFPAVLTIGVLVARKWVIGVIKNIRQ